MKEETFDEIVGRALRSKPYVPTGGDATPAQPAAAPQGGDYAELPDAEVFAIFRANCVSYPGNYEVTPGQALQIAKALRASHGQAPAGATEQPAATVIKKGADRQWMSERLGHLPDGAYSLYLAPTAQAAPAAGAVAGPNWRALQHSANEWADMAINGLQWLRNIVSGTSDAKTALANMETNLEHCREVNDAPEVQEAIRAAAAPTSAAQADSTPAEAVERIVHLRANREKRIYVAGPMTGLPEYNFPAFNAAAAALRAEGWYVENPAEHGHVEGAGWDDYLRYDLSRVATCGAVYLLPGWPKSKGATLEVHVAGVLGLQFVLADGAEPIPADSGVQEDAARWFAERDNVLHSFWMLLGEAETQADNDDNPVLKHQVEGFYRQWNAMTGGSNSPRWMERAALAAKGVSNG